MAQTVLEELVVKMVGDVQTYLKDIETVKQQTAEMAKTVEDNTKKAEGSFSGMGNALSAVAAGLAAIGAGHWLQEAAGEWAIAETTALKLEAAIGANGRTVDVVMGQYREFASELQNITVIGDDTTLAVLSLAESFDLSGESAIEATRHATALAAISGGSANSYLRLTAAIQRGDIELAQHMARMVPQLRGIKDETEFLDKANRLFTAGMAAAQAEARSSSGQIAQLKNAYGDLMEEFGKIYAEGISPFIEILKRLVGWFASLSTSTKEVIVHMAMAVTSALALISTYNALASAFNSLGGSISGTKLAFIALGVFAAYEIYKAVSGVSQLNRELTRSVDLAERLNQINARRQGVALGSAAAIGDPEERRAETQRIAQEAETRVSTAQDRLAAARRAYDASLRAPNSITSPAFIGIREAAAALREAENAAKAAATGNEEARAALARLDEEARVGGVSAFQDQVRAMEEEIEEMGRTKDEIEILRAARRGMSEEMLGQLYGLQVAREQYRNQAESQETINHMAEELALMEGMTRAQLQAAEARRQGNDAEADEIERLEGLQDYTRYIQSLAERSSAIARQVDPMENYNRQVRELNELMGTEFALTQEQYARAMAQYAEELNNSADGADRLTSSMERFNAVASGSNAAASNFSEYLRGTYIRAGRGAAGATPNLITGDVGSYQGAQGGGVTWANPYAFPGGSQTQASSITNPYATPATPGGESMLSLLMQMTGYLATIADQGGFVVVEED